MKLTIENLEDEKIIQKYGNDILIGWNRISIKANAEQGKRRTEVLLFNYDLSKQIEFKF